MPDIAKKWNFMYALLTLSSVNFFVKQCLCKLKLKFLEDFKSLQKSIKVGRKGYFCRNTSFLPKEILPAGRQEGPINTGRLPAEFRQELSAGSPPKGSYGRPLYETL